MRCETSLPHNFVRSRSPRGKKQAREAKSLPSCKARKNHMKVVQDAKAVTQKIVVLMNAAWRRAQVITVVLVTNSIFMAWMCMCKLDFPRFCHWVHMWQSTWIWYYSSWKPDQLAHVSNRREISLMVIYVQCTCTNVSSLPLSNMIEDAFVRPCQCRIVRSTC